MAPLVYTHDFDLVLDDQTITGEIEFNIDGIMTYKTDSPVDEMSLERSEIFNALLKAFKDIFDQFGGIEKIELVEKVV